MPVLQRAHCRRTVSARAVPAFAGRMSGPPDPRQVGEAARDGLSRSMSRLRSLVISPADASVVCGAQYQPSAPSPQDDGGWLPLPDCGLPSTMPAFRVA